MTETQMTETETSTDRIEKQTVVRAPRSKVWRAITDSREFGKWFEAEMTDPFVQGAAARGRITHPRRARGAGALLLLSLAPVRGRSADGLLAGA